MSDENNTPNYLNPWAKPSDNTSSSQQPAAPTQPATPPAKSPEERFAEHIASLDLTSGIDFGRIGEDMRNGETTSLQQAFTQVASNAFREAVLHANSMVDRRSAEAADKASNEAQTKMQSSMALQMLQGAMPFLKNPATEPVAQATLASLMRQGQDVETAVANAKRYFAEFGGHIGEHFSQHAGEAPEDIAGLKAFNARTSNGMGDNNPNGEPIGEEPDWRELFGVPDEAGASSSEQ